MAQSGRPQKVESSINDLRTYIGKDDFASARSILNELGINVQDDDGRTALIASESFTG